MKQQIDDNRYIWNILDGLEQPDNAPVESSQSRYWAEGAWINRTKNAKGVWKYSIIHL